MIFPDLDSLIEYLIPLTKERDVCYDDYSHLGYSLKVLSTVHTKNIGIDYTVADFEAVLLNVLRKGESTDIQSLPIILDLVNRSLKLYQRSDGKYIRLKTNVNIGIEGSNIYQKAITKDDMRDWYRLEEDVEIITKKEYKFLVELKGIILRCIKDFSEVEHTPNKIIKEEIKYSTKYRLAKHRSVEGFFNELKAKNYISQDTYISQVQSFIEGEVPDPRINWVKKERHLKYFLSAYCEVGKLEDEHAQPFKNAKNVFLIQGKELKSNWANNVELSKQIDKDEIKKVLSTLF